MSGIADTIRINKSIAPNRILMPPLVCFNWADDNGFETVDRAKHYGDRAKGGTGIIIIEASAISKAGRLADTQLGLWDDEHIKGFEKISKACHGESLVLVQIVHAGMKSVGYDVLSASDMELKDKSCKAMSLEQIEQVKADFVSAACRALKAGLDGVEIHGAHGYLLNQFTAEKTNRREDIYGGNLKGRMRLPLEIVKAVREATNEDFIISYRFGVNDKTFQEDITFAKKLEETGVNLLNVSAGIGIGELKVPEDFPYSQITYMGTRIKGYVNIPVASVYGIRYPEQAIRLLKDNMTDIVAVGRGLLADANWTSKAIANEAVDVCYECKPRCKYFTDGQFCPWRKSKRG